MRVWFGNSTEMGGTGSSGGKRLTTSLWLTYKVVHDKLGIGGESVEFRPCVHALKGQ